MTSTLRKLPGILAITTLAFMVATAPAMADIPAHLSDLVTGDVMWADQEMSARGYTLIHSDNDRGMLHEYWWSGSRSECIHVRVSDGAYYSVAPTAATDCNQRSKSAVSNDDAAKVAIAAAALIGVAALAHKSHERNGNHGQDSRSVAEFDRGYRDGLHHERYHNYNNTQAYSDGYNEGQSERDEQTNHRSPYGHHSGYQSYVRVNDLVGERAAGAESELRSRGFTDVSGYKDRGRAFTMWYNSNTRQCIQTVTGNGRMQKINDIPEGNCR